MAHLGGLAQLVERLLCKQDVSGSSPLTSTKSTYRTYFHIERHTAPHYVLTVVNNIVNKHKSLLGLPSENLENCI
jgi:hypothetical protein